MTTTEQILLIILSVFLAIFLILSIAVLVKVLQLLKQFKRIITTAEELIDKAENIADFFERSAPKVAFTRLLSNITEMVFSRGKGNKRSKDKGDD
jgi:biopolymer transport protein ExbB/TolQ